MFFSKFGRILAHLGLFLGALLALTGLVNAFLGQSVAQYFPGKTTGQLIDKGLYYMGLSIALGIMSEIALNFRR